MKVEPQKEHKWLERLVGNWTIESECDMGPGQLKAKQKGTDSVRILRGLWALCEGEGDMPDGGTATNILTLGYDPAKKCFVGTFISSCMTHLWVYTDGSLDASGKVLTLNAEGPSFTDEKKTAKYIDVIELVSNDQRTLSSSYLGDDGQWHKFMTANYRRVK